MTQLADLLVVQAQDQIFQTMLGVYQGAGFPVQSWQPFGVERTRLMAFSAALADISGTYIPQAAAGGFLDYASTNWLRLTAFELYNLAYNAASQTQGNVNVTVAAGAGPYVYTAGSLIIAFGGTGNRYINVNAGTLTTGSNVVLFGAEFSGAKYNDASNAGAITLVTPSLPGVTLDNIAGPFSVVSMTGAGTGSITPSGATTSHQVVVRFDTSGNVGEAAWSYSLDGSPYASVGITSSALMGSSGILVTLANGAIGVSFVEGDTFTFTSPGTWVTIVGTDDESSTALAQRCRNRWGTLSPIPTNSLYATLVTSTPVYGAQVAQYVISPDSVINNQVNIVVAGPTGALPGSAVAAIQAYVNPRVPITDKPVVVSPSTLAVVIAGSVTVSVSKYAAVVNAITIASNQLVAAVGINGTLRLASIEQAIMNAGATDVSGLTINGVAANLTLGSSSSFVLPLIQPLALSYVTTA